MSAHGQLPNKCEMPDCNNEEGLKACRDPENNLLEMCPECRSAWPVEPIEQTTGIGREVAKDD